MEQIPLNGVRAFCLAAHHGSFLAASRELGVTPAAVSQLVKRLEAFTGTQLFRRANREVTLTSAGRELYDSVWVPMQVIDRAVRRIKP